MASMGQSNKSCTFDGNSINVGEWYAIALPSDNDDDEEFFIIYSDSYFNIVIIREIQYFHYYHSSISLLTL
jgi:hypothetical protein